MVQIRAAGPADMPEIARLNGLFNGSVELAGSYLIRLQEPQRVDTPVIALVDGHIAGAANLRLLQPFFHPSPYAELTELFVEEDYRRKGIGRSLVAYVEQLARAAGAQQILILTDFYNHQAQSLYRALGYAHHDIALSKTLE